MKAIRSKYHGPTASKGGRIVVSDGDTRLSLPYSPEQTDDQNHRHAVFAFCANRRWSGTLVGGQVAKRGKMDSWVWVWSDGPRIYL
jgi:hypothetical protein